MSQGRTPTGSLRRALSVSLPILELLRSRAYDGQVLGVFNRACILTLEGAGPIALVLDEIGDGPLNIVVEGQTGAFQDLAPADPVRASRETIAAGSLSYSLPTVEIWDPRPDWPTLRDHKDAILKNLGVLQATALRLAPPGTLLDLIHPDGADALPGRRAGAGADSAGTQTAAVLAAARRAAQTLARCWAGSEENAQAGAAALAGLGQGLTPAGDDFLMGLMLWAWLTHPEPEGLCGRLLPAAEERTTTLSAAFLRAAARGECSAHWHNLLDVLHCQERRQLGPATEAVLAHGSTSGADTLAGFLYLNSKAQSKGTQ